MTGNPDYMPALAEYIINMYIYGVKPVSQGEMTTADLSNDAEVDFDIDHFSMLMQLPGAKVEFYMPFIKVAELDIDSEIPEGLSNRTYQEQVGTEIEVDPETGEEIQVPTYEERIHTWRTWRDSSHPLGEPVGGFYYFMSAPFGNTLPSDELLIIHNSLTAELVDAVPEIIEET